LEALAAEIDWTGFAGGPSCQILVNSRSADDRHGWLITRVAFAPKAERGESLQFFPKHSNSADQLYYVFDGSLTCGGQRLAAGVGILLPSGTVHDVYPGDEGVDYLHIIAAPAEGVEGTTVTDRRLDDDPVAVGVSSGLDQAVMAALVTERTRSAPFDFNTSTRMSLVEGGNLEGHYVQYGVRNLDENGQGWHVLRHRFGPEEQRVGGLIRIPRHQHPHEQVFVVQEGEMFWGNRRLAAGQGVLLPSNQNYDFRPGPQGVAYLEIKAAVDDGEFGVKITEHDVERWLAAGWSRTEPAAR
jgi:quercetin dioxygenase-like cupin family protein